MINKGFNYTVKKNFKKSIFYAAACMAAVLLLSSCTGSSSQNAASQTKNNAEDKTKTIKVGSTSAVVSGLDPAVDWNGWYTVRYGIAETLFRLDDSLNPVPWLASSYKNIDENTWEIKIKDNVVFSNGEKMTAQKVIDSLKRAGDMNSRAASLKDCEYTAGSDGKTITIKTKEPYVALINDLCDPYSAVIDTAAGKDFEKSPIGTGPFVISEFNENTKAVMKKNDKYWDGEVKADSIEYINVADFDTLALSINSGELDVAQDLSPESAQTLKNNTDINLNMTTQSRTYQLYFNLETMKDKAVREAVMYALDKETIDNVQLNGCVLPANGAFLENSSYGGKNLKLRKYDLSKAKELLKDAGYTDTDNDGIVEKDGKPLKIKFCIYKRLAMENMAVEMQSDLKKAGIDADVTVYEKSTFYKSGDFDIGLYSIVTMPTGDAYPFLRDCMQTDGVANFGKYYNKEVQEDLEKLSKEFNKEERSAIVDRIQQAASDDAAFDYMGFNKMYTAVSKDVEGYLTTSNDYYQVTKDTYKK